MFLDGETKAEWLRQIRYARSDQNRDILLSDKRNTPFRVSSRTVFRCVASLFFVVFIAHQKHGKHSANVFALHSMQLDWTITLVAITSARYLSLLFFFSFFFFCSTFLPARTSIDQLENWLLVVSSVRTTSSFRVPYDAVN